MLVLSLVAAVASGPGCLLTTLTDTGCVQFNFSAFPQQTFNRPDSYPESYLIAPPCQLADHTNCASCNGAPPAGVYQLEPQAGCKGSRCIRCDGGDLSTPTIEAAALGVGVNLTYSGGDGGRSTTYYLICDTTVPEDNGPDPLVLTSPAYRVVWRHPAACGVAAAPGTAGCTAPPIPQPTAAQLAWQAREIGALIHFNMMTYDSCGDPSLFQPDKLNTSQWVDSMVALGVKEAVLVAKHGCGFVLWPSKATVPGGGRYNYSVAYTTWRNGAGDVLSDFLKSCNDRGVGTGFYYSLASNAFAKKMGWSADELIAIEKQQIQELWGPTYGNHANGGHSELWFDGGFEGAIQPFVKQNLADLQPNAAVFNGCVQQGAGNNKSLCVSPNAVRWIGTESGAAPDPDWSTGYTKGGDPNSDVFQPAECDTTLQNGDAWFFNPTIGIRSLATMVQIYHETVGHNGFLMLDFAPNKDGLINPDQAARYAEVGAWIRGCYDHPLAEARFDGTLDSALEHATVLVGTDAGPFDRVVIRENQTTGQRVRGYVVEASAVGSSGPWTQLATGQSIGNKWIVLLPNASGTTAGAVRVRVTSAANGDLSSAQVASVGLFKCNRPSDSGCSTQNGIKFSYDPSEVISTTPKSTVAACCTSCSGTAACAVFLVSPTADCILLNADGVQQSAAGWTAGSPNGI